MPKQVLPTYSIHTLKAAISSPKDFSADGLAHYLEEHQNLHFPHKHSFYQLVYFTKGAGSHSIDFIQFPVTVGQVYFMVPGQVHSWAFEGGVDGYIVNFSEAYLQALIADPRYLDQFPFFSGIASEQVISLPDEGRRPVEQLLQTIVEEGNSAAAGKDDFARAALVQLFIKVNRYSDTKAGQQLSTYNTVVLRNFQKLIEQHYKEKKLPKEYAALLYVTPNHLNALCKDVTGRSAGELIRDRILLEAKRLLVNANMSVAEIAFELDFADSSYFTRFFKKYEGSTPEAFRKQFIKNKDHGNNTSSKS